MGRAHANCELFQQFDNPVDFGIQVRIGRIAGQYAKPRSSTTEMIGGKEVLSFRCALDLNLESSPGVHLCHGKEEIMSMGEVSGIQNLPAVHEVCAIDSIRMIAYPILNVS
jgi:Class-II DAHP synthetase family